jgi:hypothetical protein
LERQELAARQLLEQTSMEQQEQQEAYQHSARSCRCLLDLAQEQQPHQAAQQDQRRLLAQCSKELLDRMVALEQGHLQLAHLLAQEARGQAAVFQYQQPLDLLAETAEPLYPLGSLEVLETEAQSPQTEALLQMLQSTCRCALAAEEAEAPALQQTEEMAETADYTEAEAEAEARP